MYFWWIFFRLFIMMSPQVQVSVSIAACLSFVLTYLEAIQWELRPLGPNMCLRRCHDMTGCRAYRFSASILACTVAEDTHSGNSAKGVLYVMKKNKGKKRKSTDFDGNCPVYSTILKSRTNGQICVKFRCPSDYIYNKKLDLCYKSNQTKLQWSPAVAACEADGATLIKIDSQAKQKAVEETLRQAHDPKELNRYYISGVQDTRGVWRFHDKTLIKEFFWGGDITQYPCLLLVYDYQYKWCTGGGYYPRGFICEIKM